MIRTRKSHIVTNDAINHAARLYYSRPMRALTNGVAHALNGLEQFTAKFVVDKGHVRCTVTCGGRTNESKWFWLPLREDQAEPTRHFDQEQADEQSRLNEENSND